MSIYLYFLPVSEGQELGSNSAGLRVSHEASLELSLGAVILCRFNRLQDSPPRRLTRVALSRRPQFLTMLACPHNTADGFSLGKRSKGGARCKLRIFYEQASEDARFRHLLSVTRVTS